MKTIGTAFLSFAVLALLAAAPAPSTSPSSAPATAPAGEKNMQGLTATLIADKDSYALDPAQSGKDFRDSIDPSKNARGGSGAAAGAGAAGGGGRRGINMGGGLPKPPAVLITLRITNTSDKDVTITVNGDDSRLELKLDGPGAVNVENLGPMTMEFRIGTPVTISPGKAYDIKINSLASGMRGNTLYAYWTEPGDYTLAATLVYGQGDGKPQGKVVSAPVKLKVEATKKEVPVP